MQPCILCGSKNVSFFQKTRFHTYLECPVCTLVFLHPDKRLGYDEEKKYYELHQNNPDDQGYREFLSRLSEPMIAMIPMWHFTGEKPFGGLPAFSVQS